jgi:hypothetical protein
MTQPKIPPLKWSTAVHSQTLGFFKPTKVSHLSSSAASGIGLGSSAFGNSFSTDNYSRMMDSYRSKSHSVA